MMTAPSLRTLPAAYQEYARLRREMPVFHDAEADVWIVSRFDDVRTVLREHRHFSSCVLGQDSFEIRSPVDGSVLPAEETLLASDPPRHDALRMHVGRLFAPERLVACEAAARRELDRVIVQLVQGNRFEVVHDVCEPVVAAVMASVFGLDTCWRECVAQWLQVSGQCNARSRPASLKARFDAMLDDIWQAAEHCPDAGLGVFMAACHRGEVDARHVLDLTVTLLKGGADTTTYLVGNVLALLAEQPGLVSDIRRDPTLIPALIEASLRRDSPVQLTVRVTTADVELAGHRIPANSRVILLLGSANRDETVFGSEDEIHLDRREKSHLAFGAGPHRCPGVALARMQGGVIVQALMTRLPAFRLVPEHAREVGLRALCGFDRMDAEFLVRESNGATAGPAKNLLPASDYRNRQSER
ncbi:Putative cytochrome P450 YjiB [Cupriavidus laharis]|uniref:Cytochrome P450 YjiB n=1 Tax=Cupriavidus laharis TaxID=151654 RepID=A0ABN7Y9V6_9BURK|nr:cytochrome P450 [Cupriavidus laharis]CAG9170173.1 Putative cytochrome P450 YjiB [Cupriavidus laharis]